ncbi:MAG: diiron oxygenase [Actinomycetota bacterium]|nr:diiron oxygenase [Actinomycetota bacterium]
MTDVLTTSVDDEQQDTRLVELVRRLSEQSVVRHFDAYVDIDWDAPEMAIDPHDPRFELEPDNPLGATKWYRSLTPETRAEIGLRAIVSNMKAGLQFESILKRGLLEYAFKLPDGAPEFRYAYHEVIEEAQHSLMFQEFVNRSGLEVDGLTWDMKFGARRVIAMARRFPPQFFVFVLGGEDPIDHVQRTVLRSGRDMHPLLERIMRIHVTEEARHLSFARQYLRSSVPRLSRRQRAVMSIQAPIILHTMAGVMMRPPKELVRRYDIPKDVLREAYPHDGSAAQDVRDSLRKVRELLVELGLVGPVGRRLWKRLRLWDEPTVVAGR